MAESVQSRPTPLLVFADDWGRHPSSCQHLVRHLQTEHDVTWVNTIGMRSPRLDLATLRRGLEKLRHWTIPASKTPASNEEIPPNLRVVNPRMWPSFRSSWSRWLNRRLLLRQLLPLCLQMKQPPLAITTLPIVVDLIGILPVRSWVYYCVDDFGQWPGLDQEILQQMDDQLIDKADAVIAVSETLQQRIRSRGKQAELLTHGVDLSFWQTPSSSAGLPEVQALERPLVVFWGVIDPRMDVSFVQHLAQRLTRGTILFVGPQADADPRLWQLPRVRYLPPLPFAQLPVLAQQSAVLLMPYADVPVTRAIQPLKLKEYLATGRPVVVRDLPATRSWSDCLDLAADAETFTQRVLARLDGLVPPAQQLARQRLQEEGWQAKARLFARWAGLS